MDDNFTIHSYNFFTEKIQVSAIHDMSGLRHEWIAPGQKKLKRKSCVENKKSYNENDVANQKLC